MPSYRITALKDGFRRAGRAWTSRPTDIAEDALSADDLAALKADPMLIVDLIDEADDAPGDGADEDTGGETGKPSGRKVRKSAAPAAPAAPEASTTAVEA